MESRRLTAPLGTTISNTVVVLQFRTAAISFPLRRSLFEPSSGHVGFVVDRAALRQAVSKDFRFLADSPSARCSVRSSGAYIIDKTVAES
jgi:hypothetical protein